MQIEAFVGMRIDRIHAVPVNFDHARPFGPQVTEMVDLAVLTPHEWQTERLLVIAPAFSAIACVLMSELHGRAGFFPPIARLAPRPHVVPPVFDVVEILDLNGQRQLARERR